MGFLTSLVLMFALGWINSYLYRKYLRKRNPDWLIFLAFISILGLLTIDILIYIDKIDMTWMNVIPWVTTIEDGKDFMWNSFVIFGFDFEITHQPGMKKIAIFLLISYPIWYYFGSKVGKLIHGSRTYQQGLFWLFRPTKKVIKERESKNEKQKDIK